MAPWPEPPRAATVDSTAEPSFASAPAAPGAVASSRGATSTAASTATAHMARFEFSDLGTKILMVEWHPGPSASSSSASSSASSSVTTAAWEVSWPGKSTFLPAGETDDDEAGPRRRVYFLLPPEASIPAQVTITPPGRSKIVVKPLPAIFPPGFGVEAGTRGVLHTIWAKKRLSELQKEMEAEMRANAESVGLEMAMAEKKWIEENFLSPPPPPPPPPSSDPAASVPMSPPSQMPGRLGDKLKGLRLATSPADLVPSPRANTFTGTDIPPQTLSPQGGDVAVSSFSSIPPRGLVGHPGPEPIPMSSLNAAVRGEPPAPVGAPLRDGDDELFALPLSPRSRGLMKRGPFSTL
ncbi:hypothetical protein E4U41_007697 [Claviceps citrina]|nr:hypothetical protein E4U41_007697 [Claviceps citrina]